MVTIRFVAALICLFIAIIIWPAAIISKYGKKNRKWTTVFAFTGIAATGLFMILIWPYLPE